MGLFSNLGQEDVPRLESLADRKRQTKMPELTTKTAKSKFQQSIENQQKRLEELYKKYFEIHS